MAGSMRRSLISIRFIMDRAMERLSLEQLTLESLVRSGVDQFMVTLIDLLVGVPSDEARSRRQIAIGNILVFTRQRATEALERLTQIQHTLNQAFDLLTDQPGPHAVVERFNQERNSGSTQEQGTLRVEDIQELFELLVCLRERAPEMREQYSVWAGLSHETQTHGAPSSSRASARTAMDFRVSCLKAVSIEQSHLEDEALCAICHEMFVLGESCKQLPCLHMYHQHCILPWLSRRNSCPLCRCELQIDEP